MTRLPSLPLFTTLILLLTLLPTFTTAFSQRYACGVCETLVDETNEHIAALDLEKNHLVQTKWRIDEKRKIPFSRTEASILEILEEKLPSKITQYGVQDDLWTTNGHVKILHYSQSISEGFVNTTKLTDTLKKTYEHMREEHLEEITLAFHKNIDDIKTKLCVDIIGVCGAKKWQAKDRTKINQEKATRIAKAKRDAAERERKEAERIEREKAEAAAAKVKEAEMAAKFAEQEAAAAAAGGTDQPPVTATPPAGEAPAATEATPELKTEL